MTVLAATVMFNKTDEIVPYCQILIYWEILNSLQNWPYPRKQGFNFIVTRLVVWLLYKDSCDQHRLENLYSIPQRKVIPIIDADLKPKNRWWKPPRKPICIVAANLEAVAQRPKEIQISHKRRPRNQKQLLKTITPYPSLFVYTNFKSTTIERLVHLQHRLWI